MKPLIVCLLPLAFSLFISASPPPPITPTPTRAQMTILPPKATPPLSLTKPAPIHKLRYVYWLPWVSMSGTPSVCRRCQHVSGIINLRVLYQLWPYRPPSSRQRLIHDHL